MFIYDNAASKSYLILFGPGTKRNNQVLPTSRSFQAMPDLLQVFFLFFFFLEFVLPLEMYNYSQGELKCSISRFLQKSADGSDEMQTTRLLKSVALLFFLVLHHDHQRHNASSCSPVGIRHVLHMLLCTFCPHCLQNL